MLIWLTVQLFQIMFGTIIVQDAMAMIRVFAFIELLIEVAGVVMLVIQIILDRGKK